MEPSEQDRFEIVIFLKCCKIQSTLVLEAAPQHGVSSAVPLDRGRPKGLIRVTAWTARSVHTSSSTRGMVTWQYPCSNSTASSSVRAAPSRLPTQKTHSIMSMCEKHVLLSSTAVQGPNWLTQRTKDRPKGVHETGNTPPRSFW
jgi:hypothetical protein